jgi:DNA-binding transcriptional LysR family regulator
LRFDLTDMRLFLTVVEQGSLTKGAESLNLGSRFRERTHFRNGIFAWRAASGAKQAGVTTTAAGDALIRHAPLILDQVEQMRGELST